MAGAQGIILDETRSEEERQLTPLRPQLSPRRQGIPRAVPALPRPQGKTENLIDDMDVYALSPHAARLALPRMIPPQLSLALKSGSAHLPPPAQWEEMLRRASQMHGLPLELVVAVVRTESNFEPQAISPRGAQGLMQLMPETALELGVTNPYDPEANVLAGCAYLRQQLTRFGSLELALAAYNAGPGNVERYNGIPPFAETQTFVRLVLQRMGTP